MQLLHFLSLATLSLALAPRRPWDAFNYAPKSRTVYPDAIRVAEGTVQIVKNKGSRRPDIPQLRISRYKLIGHRPLIHRITILHPPRRLRLILPRLAVSEIPGYWTQPEFSLWGGFRFLTVVSTGTDAVTISNVSCAISFMPHVEDLRAYSGYFYAKDPGFHDVDFLTKIWMAGAYTVQTNIVPLDTGRMVPFQLRDLVYSIFISLTMTAHETERSGEESNKTDNTRKAKKSLTRPNQRPSMISVAVLLTQRRTRLGEGAGGRVGSGEHSGKGVSCCDELVCGDELGGDGDQ
ncbi:hypothetical protein R3P38DRAFT_2772098 [Favolaschia claudopus]|uniref:Uncharacterized protein n=1 Tax=Favolaschia claudopus TaxID=2862362 RepID=A0AAW0C852_9AGAR